MWEQKRRLADAMRLVIERLVPSNAPVEELRAAAYGLERYAEAYRNELIAFADCLVRDVEPPVSGEDGRASMVLAMAARLSLEQGRPVSPQEVAHGG